MRYGGYDLRKASKSKAPASHNSLRLKKMRSTASCLVGHFNWKITDSLKRLRLQRGNICESPVSFQCSLFEQEQQCSTNYSLRYQPADFRSHFNSAGKASHDYVFGTNFCNFATRNLLNGKSTINIINTLQQFEQQHDRPKATPDDPTQNVFSKLIELSSSDASLEYRLVSDYLDCNTYSEIENDSEFKDYLQRKNYGDILEYLDESEPKSFMSVSSSVARAQSALNKSTLNNAKSLATPKQLQFVGLSSETSDAFSQVCFSCRTNLRSTPNNNGNPTKKPPGSSSHFEEAATTSNSYDESLQFCIKFFTDTCAKNSSTKLPNLRRNSSFREHKYEELLKQFIKAQGYTTVEKYVEEKFGQLLSTELSTDLKKQNQLPKNSDYAVQKVIKCFDRNLLLMD